MKKENELLSDKLIEIRDLLLELEFLKKDILSIINAKEEHKDKFLNKSRFFYRLHINYIRLFVIDLYKLIGEKEDYNLFKTINFCKTNLKRINWEREIKLEELEILEEKLKTISIKFNSIKGLRDKFYAHNDKKKRSFSYKISLKEMWEVLETIQYIFSELCIHFNNEQWIFELQYRSPGIIPKLYKYELLREAIFDYYAGDANNSNIVNLVKIIRSR